MDTTHITLTDGINHVAAITPDLPRLTTFYADVFGAGTVFDVEDAGHRHAMIRIGSHSGIHAFEVADADTSIAARRMFERGPLDHMAITASSPIAFDVIRTRAMARGASSGDLTDYGPIEAFHLRDPDGNEIEVCCFKPGVSLDTPPPDRAKAAARLS